MSVTFVGHSFSCEDIKAFLVAEHSTNTTHLRYKVTLLRGVHTGAEGAIGLLGSLTKPNLCHTRSTQ